MKDYEMICKKILKFMILDKLDEVPKSPTSVFQRVVATLQIPPSISGTCEGSKL